MQWWREMGQGEDKEGQSSHQFQNKWPTQYGQACNFLAQTTM